MKITEAYPIEKYVKSDINIFDDSVIVEYPLDIYLNNKNINTLFISPQDVRYLVLGYLFTNGFIQSADDIISIKLLEDKGKVFIRTKDSSERFSSSKKHMTMKIEDIYDIVKEFENKSDVFKNTGAAHSAALACGKKIIRLEEDVSRSNAVDKLIGYIIDNKIDLSDKYLLLSCRISQMIMEKILSINISTVISISPPTSLAIDMAKDRGINLIGFARDRRFTLYNRKNLELV